MADKITKIAISDNEAQEKNDTNITSAINENQDSAQPANTADQVTVSGEKRIEPLQNDEPQEKTNEDTNKIEPEEHPTPDSSQLMTAKAEEEMQNPKLFDTKEYHLPITQSVHGHGSKAVAIVFGIIFAILALAAALYVLQ